MATGRDATDVAITTSFGNAWLSHFAVVSDEVIAPGVSAPDGEAVSQAGGVGLAGAI